MAGNVGGGCPRRTAPHSRRWAESLSEPLGVGGGSLSAVRVTLPGGRLPAPPGRAGVGSDRGRGQAGRPLGGSESSRLQGLLNSRRAAVPGETVAPHAVVF